MAGSLQDIESWLPTEFLTEEELLMDKENFLKNAEFNPSFSFPSEFPYEFDSFGSSSSLSSPDESVIGSTETESSNEDDFLAGLTRRLTQQLTVKSQKKTVMAGSPESTLSGIGSWSVSSNGSPNGVLSPPTTPFGAKNDTWDLIYAAAGQVARLKMSNEGNKYSNQQGRGLLCPLRSQNPETALKYQNTGFYSSQCYGHSVPQMNQYHCQARQEQMLKQQCPSIWGKQQVKVGWQAQSQPQHHHSLQQHQLLQPQHHHQQQQMQNRNRGVCCEHGRCAHPPALPQSAWPSIQKQNHHQQQQQQSGSNSGMRAVFLGGSGVKKECAGTGVFLPRRYGNPTESKKKSACSTVLLPAKVVQALNLNFEDVNIKGRTHNQTQPCFNSSLASDYDAFMARRNALLAQQKRNIRAEGVLNHELLPQEWTY